MLSSAAPGDAETLCKSILTGDSFLKNNPQFQVQQCNGNGISKFVDDFLSGGRICLVVQTAEERDMFFKAIMHQNTLLYKRHTFEHSIQPSTGTTTITAYPSTGWIRFVCAGTTGVNGINTGINDSLDKMVLSSTFEYGFTFQQVVVPFMNRRDKLVYSLQKPVFVKETLFVDFYKLVATPHGNEVGKEAMVEQPKISTGEEEEEKAHSLSLAEKDKEIATWKALYDDLLVQYNTTTNIKNLWRDKYVSYVEQHETKGL
jgi:hypothetical protein